MKNPSTSAAQPDKSSQAPPNSPSVTANGQPVPVPAPNDSSHSILSVTKSTYTAAPTPPAKDEKSPSITKRQVVGSAAGGTAALAALIGAAFYFMRRRRRRNFQASTPNRWTPDRITSHKPETASGTVFEKHSESGTGGAVEPAELHSYSASPMTNKRPMNERYPSLNARSLTKSPGVAGDARYYNPTTQSELDAISPPHRVSELDTLSPVAPRSPVSPTPTMNTWHAPPTSPPPPNHAELDTGRIASPVSEMGESVGSGTHPAELHGEAAAPRYADLRGVRGPVEGGVEQQAPERQAYVAYTPGAAGVAKNF